MIYSKQKFYCQVCGKELFCTVKELYASRCCDKKCYDEYIWRETLSILGKQYYSKKSLQNE